MYQRQRTAHFADGRAAQQCWLKDELPYFHHVGAILSEAGLRVETDSGVTDEGEPWFVLCDTDSGEVVAHFARIDGEYIACARFLNGPLKGRVLSDLVARFVDCCPGRRMTACSSLSTPAA